MFDYDFMRYAFIAGIFIALISCVMGVFVVARQTSFFTRKKRGCFQDEQIV